MNPNRVQITPTPPPGFSWATDKAISASQSFRLESDSTKRRWPIWTAMGRWMFLISLIHGKRHASTSGYRFLENGGNFLMYREMNVQAQNLWSKCSFVVWL